MIRRIMPALFAASLPVLAAAHDNVSSTSTRGDMTCITSNGAPNHDMGRFPNRANPNSFREQTLTFCFPTEPRLSSSVTEGLMTVGVSLTGVPFRPYTAGYYDPNGRNGISQRSGSGWRQQAMHAPRRLGMDSENGHVDRSGLYHYHAVSPAYFASTEGTLIGYAPDGFEIHYDPGQFTSSWQLKQGDRPTAPFGPHDGLFEEDFEYVQGAGTLDECNGAMVDESYRYFATDSYPYFPRCFKGLVNQRFIRRN